MRMGERASLYLKSVVSARKKAKVGPRRPRAVSEPRESVEEGILICYSATGANMFARWFQRVDLTQKT